MSGKLTYFFFSTNSPDRDRCNTYSASVTPERMSVEMNLCGGAESFILPVDGDFFNGLSATIDKRDMFGWNKFRPDPSAASDTAEGFALRAKFDSGKRIRISAKGSFPENYEQCKNDLEAHFNALCDKYWGRKEKR
ncbi:MAG: hypothetical protein IJG63_07430 [Oscillospiraceae bacterium]|nr:hypothetical protein [Oscillospiraceae bacterium]